MQCIERDRSSNALKLALPWRGMMMTMLSKLQDCKPSTKCYDMILVISYRSVYNANLYIYSDFYKTGRRLILLCRRASIFVFFQSRAAKLLPTTPPAQLPPT